MNIRRRGFSLIEMVTALAVMGSLAVLGTQLVRNSLRLAHESVAAEESTIRMHSAIAALRSDVWNAKELTAPEPHSLHINSASQNSVDWLIDGDDLTRSEKGEQRSWIGAGKGTVFEIDGPSVILHSIIRGSAAELRLVSQIQLASGKTP